MDEPVAAKMVRQARQAEARQDREEAAAEAERAAAAEDERDRRLLAFRQVGIAGKSLEETFAEAARIGDEDQEFEAARSAMERIERRRERRVQAMRSQMEQVAAVASRSVPADPFEAATQRAHRAFAEATRAKMAAAAVSPQRERRPFVSRGAVMDDAQREGRAQMTGREIIRVCAAGPDGVLRNYAPDFGMAVR